MGNDETQVPETNLGRIEELSPWRRWMIILRYDGLPCWHATNSHADSLCVGMTLSMMDNSIVSTSLYTIALEFDSLADAIWTILAYSLSYLGANHATFNFVSNVFQDLPLSSPSLAILSDARLLFLAHLPSSLSFR